MTHYTTVNVDEYYQILIGDKTFLVMEQDIYLPTDLIEIHEDSDSGKSMICFIDNIQKDSKGIEKGCSVISIRSTRYELDLN